MGCGKICCSSYDASDLYSSHQLGENSNLNSQSGMSLESPHARKDPIERIRTGIAGLLGSTESMDTFELWVKLVYRTLETLLPFQENIETVFSYRSDGTVTLMHTVNEVRCFDHIQNFCEALDPEGFDLEKFLGIQEFLLNLSPLSLTYYLRIGKTVDAGVGIERSINKTQIKEFLKGSRVELGIPRWIDSDANNPIATYCSFSCMADIRSIHFYVFSGHYYENYAKAYDLFEYIGCELPALIRGHFNDTKSEQVRCLVELKGGNGVELGLQVSNGKNIPKIIGNLPIKNKVKMIEHNNELRPRCFTVKVGTGGAEIELSGDP